MQNPYIHNSLFRPSRLIYLADNSGKSPNPEGGKNEDDSPLTDYQKHMAHTLSSGVHKLSEEDFQGSHKLDPAILEDLFNSKNSKLKDGSYDKTDKNDPYNLFMQALKNGMFPKRGKNAERFLRALDGGNNEEKAAIKILKDNGRGPISENKFDKLLNKLEEATQEDAQQELEKAMAEFGEQVSSPTQSVDITELLKQTAEFEDKPELTLEPMKFGAFEIAPPDPELVKKYNEMVSEFNEKSHEFAQEVIKQIRAGEEFFGDVSGKSDQEIEQMKKTLQSTTNGLLVELNRTQKLKKKLEPVKQQALDYYYRNIARYQDLRIFGKLTGIDLLRLTKLKIWDLKTSKDGTSLEMGGLKVKKTGATEKAWGEIEIVKIHFRNDQNDEGDSPGALVIEYRENNSKETVETSMSNFIGLLNGLEAHEEIDDLESLNLIIKEETGDKNLEQGDSFKAEKLVDIDEDGNGIYETEEFKIEAIDPESKKIKLDKVIIKIPQRDLQLSISNQLYFDHAQQEYSYGEFARMLKYRGFHRSDQADEQTIRRVQNPAYPEQGPRPQVPTERPDQFDIDEALEEMGVVPPEDQENPPTQTSPPTVPEIAQGQTPEPPLAETAQGQTPEPPLAATASTSTSTQEKPSKPELGEPKKIKAKYNKEALPYDDVFKVGNMDIKGRNYAKELWGSTTFLCVDDVWELAKACWEFYQRRWQRKQKARYSGAFKDSPIIDKEMKRINQAAENEEMGQYKESLDQMGVREVQERLRVTKDQDELKACYSVLSASGQMNWDDIEMWKNLNNFVDSSLSIPIPRNGDPRTRISKDSERTG
ncbi:hypothetical protein KJ632_05130, partial [Patescibacteria group bacterium]|nr:hypothetical protein [Patescibacteria group bacterium]